MTAATLIMDRQACFQLKTNFAPCTILQLSSYDLALLEKQLDKAIQRAPNFFIGSPIIIDLEKIKDIDSIDFVALKQILAKTGMVPMGVRGGSELQLTAAASHSLPVLTIGKLAHVETPAQKEKEAVAAAALTSKIITTPIRSGMQVYAKNTDLIVIANVSAGSELLADGHIHVYGALRGRALAGMQGNKEARIFCRELDAELLSIAGYYLTKEEIPAIPENNQMIQIFLKNNKLQIAVIS
jgi:septum site-determining protein MinC